MAGLTRYHRTTTVVYGGIDSGSTAPIPSGNVLVGSGANRPDKLVRTLISGSVWFNIDGESATPPVHYNLFSGLVAQVAVWCDKGEPHGGTIPLPGSTPSVPFVWAQTLSPRIFAQDPYTLSHLSVVLPVNDSQVGSSEAMRKGRNQPGDGFPSLYLTWAVEQLVGPPFLGFVISGGAIWLGMAITVDSIWETTA